MNYLWDDVAVALAPCMLQLLSQNCNFIREGEIDVFAKQEKSCFFPRHGISVILSYRTNYQQTKSVIIFV